MCLAEWLMRALSCAECSQGSHRLKFLPVRMFYFDRFDTDNTLFVRNGKPTHYNIINLSFSALSCLLEQNILSKRVRYHFHLIFSNLWSENGENFVAFNNDFLTIRVTFKGKLICNILGDSNGVMPNGLAANHADDEDLSHPHVE